MKNPRYGAGRTNDAPTTNADIWARELRGRLEAFRIIGSRERGGYGRWADEQASIVAEELSTVVEGSAR